ncbi:HPr-rel-A system PqqD family peptide chaperone [Spirosoma rigui]|uniref:HPr-rel-A system PqqD family peptide chaperone n=1 Tax=Spirosoma rigui TaxID=564064 RepID=UPI0009B02308|nr:HPr-rel-A system PqqD family peptide chaperone [Spirosoma rigui]
MLGHMVYFCSQDVLESKIDDEIVLMSISTGEYYGLDETGSRIWELLTATPMTLTSLCQALQVEFDVDEATCQEDTSSFLQDLVEKGLVTELSEV